MKQKERHLDHSLLINKLSKKGKWVKARGYIIDWLKEKPSSHWLLTQLSETYYEEKNYKKALAHIEDALKIAPSCSLVLWDYASTLDMLERNAEALRVFLKLIHRGVRRIAYDECGEGVRWARSLVNDCRYRVGLIYARIGDFELANKFLLEHLTNRSRNCPSIYGLRDVRKDLALIQNSKDPRTK